MNRISSKIVLIEDAEPLAHWAHDYAPAMARVARVQGRLGAAGLVHTATSFFDEHLRVEQMAHFAGTQLRQGWSYRFDPLRPQRRVGRMDMVVERPGWAWGYNERGEVTSAQRIQSVAGAAPVAGQGWGYGYDAIGNRLQATRSTAQVAVIDSPPESTPQTMTTSYSPNGFNQYTGITRPGALEVSGVTDPAVPEVSVTIGPDAPNYAGLSTLEFPEGQTRPAGNGEPGGYALWVKGTELTSLGQWPLLQVTATRPAEDPSDPPVTQTQSGRVWVRPSEAPVHDADGNLISDGGWTYQWDAENRLIAAEMKADALPGDMAQMRLEFHYDWLSRRVVTVTKEKRIPAGQTQRPADWTTLETRHFWYDGWNLMAETVQSGATGSVAVKHRYAWGVDLGGTWETGMGNHGPGRSQTVAGGVGAMLGVIAPNDKTYSATHDANGNVMGFIDLETGVLAARFDYDAFGTLITDWSAPGHHAWEISRIRFSGKYQDPHTGWLYYGYRYLDTVNGRWPSRDPIGEEGGVNLYGMVGNDPVNQVDILGLADITVTLNRASRDEFGTYGSLTVVINSAELRKAIENGSGCCNVTSTRIGPYLTIELPPGVKNPRPAPKTGYYSGLFTGSRSGQMKLKKGSDTSINRMTASYERFRPAGISDEDWAELQDLGVQTGIGAINIHMGMNSTWSGGCPLIGKQYIPMPFLLEDMRPGATYPGLQPDVAYVYVTHFGHDDSAVSQVELTQLLWCAQKTQEKNKRTLQVNFTRTGPDIPEPTNDPNGMIPPRQEAPPQRPSKWPFRR